MHYYLTDKQIQDDHAYIINTFYFFFLRYSCFIVDRSGFIVVHEQFIGPSDSAFENVHITQQVLLNDQKSPVYMGYALLYTYIYIDSLRTFNFQEYLISQYLIKNKLMDRKKCDDFEKKDTYHTWRV